MEKAKLLIVEDAADQQLILKTILGPHYDLNFCNSSEEAKTLVATTRYDLLLIDVVLNGDETGFELAAYLQSSFGDEAPPVIFITGKGSSSSKVLGFSLGASDYIVKPFDPQELKARVDAKMRLLRRRNVKTTRIADLIINPEEQKAYIDQDGHRQELSLTSHEFKILHLLARHSGVTVSRDQILNFAWGADLHVEGRNVDTHISHIRKKVSRAGVSIRAVYGEGYRLETARPDKRSA